MPYVLSTSTQPCRSEALRCQKTLTTQVEMLRRLSRVKQRDSKPIPLHSKTSPPEIQASPPSEMEVNSSRKPAGKTPSAPVPSASCPPGAKPVFPDFARGRNTTRKRCPTFDSIRRARRPLRTYPPERVRVRRNCSTPVYPGPGQGCEDCSAPFWGPTHHPMDIVDRRFRVPLSPTRLPWAA